MNSSSDGSENRLTDIEVAVASTSDNITGVWAERTRSGLGTNLDIAVDVNSTHVTAEELDAMLRAAAPLTPERIGVVQFTAWDPSGEIVSLTEVGTELAIPALNTNSSAGEVTIPAADLREAFRE